MIKATKTLDRQKRASTELKIKISNGNYEIYHLERN